MRHASKLVGVLVGDDQVLGRGLDAEMARRLAAGALLLDIGQRPFLGVDVEQHHRVVAAVRGVDPFAAGVDRDFGAGVADRRNTRRKAGDGLDFGELAGGAS